MKRKELKNLAMKIAAQEKILQNPNTSAEERKNAEDKIMKISSSIKSIEDLIEIDEIVMSILEESNS